MTNKIAKSIFLESNLKLESNENVFEKPENLLKKPKNRPNALATILKKANI